MDWLDEKIEPLMKLLGNLSLRKALIGYIVVCVLTVTGLYAFTMSVCEKLDHNIWSKYLNVNDLADQNIVVYYQDYSKLNKPDQVAARIIDFFQNWSMVIYSIGGVIGISLLFYNKKLKQPLCILQEAALQVGNSNLDFEIYYDSKDEMGDLCRSFDFMRKQLIRNNQKMWEIMEEQKRLNAAFAHDLRTPLTVLRGYTDFLCEYVPEGKISEEKLISTLTLMANHIDRLESYSNTMKQIHSFEELTVKQSGMTCQQLLEKMNEVISVLNGRNEISIKLNYPDTEYPDPLLLDEAILMEVFENLVSNALRYAKAEIEIRFMISDAEQRLILSVADDGRGFSTRDLSMAVKPYYTDGENKSSHFGIGLYICKLLCEKHGGYLSLSNSMKRGAIVTASFCIIDLNLYENVDKM